MKHLCCIVFLLAAFGSTNAQGISFYEDGWENALKEAQEQDKIIFVDAYAKWCGPCKRMAREVFTLQEVGDFYNENFINLKIDMEEPPGFDFGKKYPVGAYPTLYFIDNEGNVLKKVVGGKQAGELISLGEQAIKLFDRSDQYAERYEAGERDFSLMLSYIKELNKVGKPSLKIANEYLNSDPDISDEQMAEFLLAAVLESDSKIYEQLIGLKRVALELISESELEELVSAACLKTVEKAVEFDYPELMEQAIRSFEEASIGDNKQFESEARLYYHAMMGGFMEWRSISTKFLKKYGKKNPDFYKEHLAQVTKYFNYSSEAKAYSEELKLSLLKYQETAFNYAFYIRSLMNDRENEKALKYCKEAIKKFKNDPLYDQFKQMRDYLEKLVK